MAIRRCVLLRNVINGLCRVGDAVGHSSTLTLGGGGGERGGGGGGRAGKGGGKI